MGDAIVALRQVRERGSDLSSLRAQVVLVADVAPAVLLLELLEPRRKSSALSADVGDVRSL
jgi:hypothetical protein